MKPNLASLVKRLEQLEQRVGKPAPPPLSPALGTAAMSAHAAVLERSGGDTHLAIRAMLLIVQDGETKLDPVHSDLWRWSDDAREIDGRQGHNRADQAALRATDALIARTRSTRITAALSVALKDFPREEPSFAGLRGWPG